MDVMDASGVVQTNIPTTMMKTRLDKDGNVIVRALMELGKEVEPPPKDYCGPCYGGKSPNEDGCCNTCQDVRDAYQANGWAIKEYNDLEQCAREQFVSFSKSPSNLSIFVCSVTKRISSPKPTKDVILRATFK